MGHSDAERLVHSRLLVEVRNCTLNKNYECNENSPISNLNFSICNINYSMIDWIGLENLELSACLIM